MRNLRNIPSPRLGPGVVTGEALNAWWDSVQREMLAALDVRNGRNDFAGGMYQDDTGKLVIGADAGLTGRPSSSLPTVLDNVGDDGQASSVDLLPLTQTGGLTSTQDSGPVSAEADSLSAEITVAAHTVQHWDGVLVSYNAGTITGLSPNTDYFVYYDDPTRAGGAVSYSATTNRQTTTAVKGRAFAGAVRTTTALTVATITGATSANPIVFTSSAPTGWNTGNTVVLAGLPGDFAALNGTVQAITRTGASTFSVSVNGSGFGAYSSGGTATRESRTAISGSGGPSGWVDMAFLGQF